MTSSIPPSRPTFQLGQYTVHRVGFGAMQLPGPGVFGPPRDHDQAIAVLRRAVELGVDHIDTAQYYGPDVVNDLIREALHPYPDDLKLVTKVGARRDDQGAWLKAARPDELTEQVEANLRALDIERLDLVNLRLMDADVPLAEQIGALQELQQQGKLDLIGMSNVSRQVAEEALALTPLGEVQNAYSVIDREHEDVLEFCRENEIAFVPFFPLGSAFTGGLKRILDDPHIGEVARRHGVLPTQVALAWLLERYDRTLLIPGTSSVAHLEENLAAGEVQLDADDLATLEQVEQVSPPVH
jgi:pyridoxine 4-dehydrogenase